MARVLIPTRSMRYNPNPRGSATTTVAMRADNPFERVTHVRNGRMLPGLGALTVPETLTTALPQSAVEAAKSTSSIDWGSLATQALQTGIQIGGQVATQQLVKPQVTPLPVQSPTYMPVVQPVVSYAREATSSKLPMMLIAAGVLGLGAFFVLRKKR